MFGGQHCPSLASFVWLARLRDPTRACARFAALHTSASLRNQDDMGVVAFGGSAQDIEGEL